MPVLRAEAVQVTYGEQTAFGTATTAAGASRWIGAVKTVDGMFPDIDWKEIRARGSDRDVYLYIQGKRTLEGSIRFYPQFQSNRILKYAFGSVSHSGAGDPFTHTISGATGVSDPGPPITLRRAYQTSATTEEAFYVRDCIVDSMELTGAEEDILECVLNIKGGKPSPARANEAIMSVTKDSTSLYPYSKGIVTINGTATARVKSFTFKIENGGSMKYRYQSTDGDYPYEYVPGSRKYTFECQVVPVDGTFMALLDAATPSTTATFNVKFTGQATPERSIEIKGNVTGAIGVTKSAPHDIPDEGEITVALSMMVNKAQIVVLDGNASTVWDSVP